MGKLKGFMRPSGNHCELLSCQKADVAYAVNYPCCHKILARADRTIGLIHQATCLLDQRKRRTEHDMPKHGGLRECMTRAYLEACADEGRHPCLPR